MEMPGDILNAACMARWIFQA